MRACRFIGEILGVRRSLGRKCIVPSTLSQSAVSSNEEDEKGDGNGYLSWLNGGGNTNAQGQKQFALEMPKSAYWRLTGWSCIRSTVGCACREVGR